MYNYRTEYIIEELIDTEKKYIEDLKKVVRVSVEYLFLL